MNCRVFDATVVDLVRSPMMDASVRDEALEHAAGCDSCAVRLADERALSTGFRALAAVESERVAPKWREAELRAAFRERFAVAGSGLQIGNSRIGSRWPGWTLTAAAALAVLLGAAVAWRMLSSGAPAQKSGGGQVTAAARTGETSIPKGEGPSQSPGKVEVLAGEKRGKRQNIPHARLTGPTDTAYVAVSLGEFQPIVRESEQATDFLPIVESPQMQPLDSGQVIRVEMPRSAMSYFGLPMQVDRPDGRVKADVLVGEDGLARAIRFVR